MNSECDAGQTNARPYSIVCYMWGSQYQQSNQWPLETLAAALEPTVNLRGKAQSWLKLRDYEQTHSESVPSPAWARARRLPTSRWTTTNAKRYADRIATAPVTLTP